MKVYVLSGYPLSRGYRQALEAKIQATTIPVLLIELRQKGFIGMLQALREMRGERLYVAYEDPSSTAILPVLRIAASASPIKNQYLVDDRLQVTPMSIAHTAKSVIGLAGASITNMATCGLLMTQARQLLGIPRQAYEMRGRRVLYLNANLWFGLKAGGSVGHVSGVVNAFAKEGYDVLFCSAGGRLMVDEHIPYQQLETAKHFGMPWESNYYSFDSRVFRQVKRTARDFAPSFIYQRMSLGNYSGVRLSRYLNVPLILEYNGSEVWISRNWGRPLRLHAPASLAEEACLRHAHLVVTVSDVLRDELVARGVEPSRIINYPNCIDPAIFNPEAFSATERNALRAKYYIEPDAIVVTFLGSFGQWHGVPVLAEAIRWMIDNRADWLDSNKVRFVLIGDGLKMPEVKNILGDHASGKYVRLTGLVPQEQAPAHLAASDILSSPHVANSDGTPFFGSPTKLFEYMAMGKAIVASDLDQIGNVLRNSLSTDDLPKASPDPGSALLAVLCTPGSAAAHARGIQFLVEREDWRTRLGKNARDEALNRYTWTTHVRHILAGIPAGAPQ